MRGIENPRFSLMKWRVIYQADINLCTDDLLVVERLEDGRYRTAIVRGNYPIDFLYRYSGDFESEKEATNAAEAIDLHGAEYEAVLSVC